MFGKKGCDVVVIPEDSDGCIIPTTPFTRQRAGVGGGIERVGRGRMMERETDREQAVLYNTKPRQRVCVRVIPHYRAAVGRQADCAPPAQTDTTTQSPGQSETWRLWEL